MAGSETLVRLFKNTVFTEHLQWLLLSVSGFQSVALFKKGSSKDVFSVNFAKFLRTSFYRAPSDDCFLCLPVTIYAVTFRNFLGHLFYRALLGNSSFHVQLA